MMANSILEALSKDNLKRIAEHESVKLDQTSPTKKQIIDKLIFHIEDTGSKLSLQLLQKKQLDKLGANLKLDEGVSRTKIVLVKKIMEEIQSKGAHNFLDESADVESLKSILSTLGDEEPNSNKKSELILELEKLIQTNGLEGVMSHFDETQLKAFLKDMSIKCKSHTKNVMIECIMTMKSPAPAEKKEVKKEPDLTVSKKGKITKGLTYDDLYQFWNATDLVDYCKENKLKVSGAKKDLINRILAFLDGDTETTQGRKKPKKRARSATPTKKKKAKEGKEGEEPKKKRPRKEKDPKEMDEKEREKKEKKEKEKEAKEKERERKKKEKEEKDREKKEKKEKEAEEKAKEKEKEKDTSEGEEGGSSTKKEKSKKK